MQNILKNLLIIFCFCFALGAKCQSFFTEFEYLNYDDGLPQNHVFSVNQDEFGFVWFCTMGGLSKYDGFNFVNYLHNSADSLSISSSFTDRFLRDSKGRYWVTTNNGLNQLLRKTGQFKRYINDESNSKSLGHNITKDIKEDANGFLWIVHDKGIDRFEPQKEEFSHYYHDDFSVNRYAGDICIDNLGNIWVLGVNGLYIVNQKAGKLDFVGTPNIDTDAVLEGKYIYQDSNGDIWVAFNRGLFTFEPKTKEFIPIANFPLNTNVSSVIEYPKGFMAIGTVGQGIIVYSLKNKQMVNRFNYDPSDPLGIANSTVYSLFVDKSNNLWLGLFNGVNRINPSHQRFGLLQNQTGVHNLKNYTLLVYGDNQGGLWSNTMEGLMYREHYFAKYKSILNPPEFAFGHHDVRGFADLDKDNILINIRSNGLYKYNKITESLNRLGEPSFLKNDFISYIKLDPFDKNILWVSGANGLGKIDLQKFDLKWMESDSIQKSNSSKKFMYFDVSSNGIIYFVQNKYLFEFNPQNNVFKILNNNIPIENTVFSVQSYQEKVWVATQNGIFCYSQSAKEFNELLDSNNTSYISSGLQVDKSGNIWNIYKDFVQKIDLKQNKASQYKSPTPFVYGIGHKTPKDEILFGGSHGVLYIQPNDYFIDSLQPNIIFKGIEVLNKKVKLDVEDEFVTDIVLDYEDKVFTLHYGALHFVNRKNIIYRYKLENFDKEWIEAGEKQNVTYTNLSPGKFTFWAEAINEDGITSENKLKINIIIKAPFYKTSFFNFLMLLIVGLITYVYFSLKRKTKIAMKEKEIAEKNAKYKDMFLSNMSHEIRTPMNSIIGLNKLLLDTPLNEKQKNYLDAILTSGENLLWIVNDILDQAKIESGKYKIQNETFSLNRLLDKIETLFRFKAEDKGLEFIMSIDPHLPDILISDKVRIFQILNNLLNNAIKFTDEGHVSLSVDSQPLDDENYHITFIIEDTGIGIPSHKIKDIFESFHQLNEKEMTGNQGVGLGLSIVRSLSDLLGGKIEVDSTKDVGTKIYFKLNMPKGDYIQSENVKENITLPESLSILLVEDTPFNQLIAIELLKKHAPHSHVDIAENGKVAIEKIQSHFYHFVLMDVKMPVMSGIDATRYIRHMNDENIKNIPILGLTASAIPQQIEQCLLVGMNDVITKPINADELVHKIFKILNND